MTLYRDFRAMPPWPTMLGLVLATGWLLPNHYAPWNTFHTNAWIGIALLLVAFWRVQAGEGRVQVSPVAALLLAVAAVPWLQHAAGMVPLAGDALVSSLYLAGAALAFILGEQWSRGQAGAPAGFVLMAAAVAAVFCVGLQIYQWLGFAVDVGWEDFWIFPSGTSRPYANFGQPNQLASLQLWGLLGVAWAWHRGFVRAVVACGLAVFILFGLALTESRTALLTLTLSVVALSIWRPAFIDRRTARCVQALYIVYLALLFGVAPAARLGGHEAELTVFARSAGELRGIIWRMAVDAASVKPWAGYGWNHTNEALFEVFPRHMGLSGLYLEQSHNLLLDLALWAGIPFALFCGIAGAWWLWRVARSIDGVPQLLSVAALCVMLVHAMLELPLHHGYFLWPFAVIAGSATTRLAWAPVLAAPRRAAAAVLVATTALCGVIVHDYFAVETAFQELRFQLQRIGRGHDETPPSVILLNEWADFIVMSRTPARSGMSPDEIGKWQQLMIYNTSPFAMRKVVDALALNGRPEESRYWELRSCALHVGAHCKAAPVVPSPASSAPAP